MNRKVTGIVAYLTPIGWIIAYLAGDKEGAKFHLNQSLVIWLFSIICSIILEIPIIGIIGSIGSLVALVFWILGIVAAIKEENKEVPLIGGIHLL